VVLFGGGPTVPGYTNQTFLYDSRANTWREVGGEESAEREKVIANLH
jgi:hypothetical protein